MAGVVFAPADSFGLSQPANLGLPFVAGETGRLLNGPHTNNKDFCHYDPAKSGLLDAACNSLDLVPSQGVVGSAGDGIAHIPCPNLVEVDHKDGWVTGYYHLIDIKVRDGDLVKAGQRLGTISEQHGCGGGAVGAHVHFFVKYSPDFVKYSPQQWKGMHNPFKNTAVDQDLQNFVLGGWQITKTPNGPSGITGIGGCMTSVSTGQRVCSPNGVASGGSVASAASTPAWLPVSLPGFDPSTAQFVGVSCGGPTSCLLVARVSSAGSQNTSLYWARTTDGKTWTQVSGKGLPSFISLEARSTDVLACPTPTHCYVITAPPQGSTSASQPTSVWKTTDGGDSWVAQIQNLPSQRQGPLAQSYGTIACSSETTCIEVSDGARLAGTTNGQHWTPHPAPWPATSLATDAGCVQGSGCYFVTYDQTKPTPITVWWTGNAGASFRASPVTGSAPVDSPGAALGAAATLVSGSCGASRHCLITQGTNITENVNAAYWTSDGGTTWTHRSLPAPASSVACVTDTTCFAPTDHHATGSFSPLAMAATTDRGMTWHLESIPTGLATGRPVCTTTMHCWALAAQDQGSGNATLLMRGTISPTPSTTTTTTVTPPATTTAPATTVPVAISHDQFVAQADALCRQTSAQIPAANDPTDLQALANTVNASLTIYPNFLGQVSTLIATQPDQTNLSTNWLSPIQTDFNAAQALGSQFVQAVHNGDTQTATQLLDQISATPDHRTAVETFLNAYGLTDCATLEAQ